MSETEEDYNGLQLPNNFSLFLFLSLLFVFVSRSFELKCLKGISGLIAPAGFWSGPKAE